MSGQRTVTFTADISALFDMLAKMNGDFSSLGNRMVSALLADPDTVDRIGMGVYGVQVSVGAEVEQ